MIWHLGHIHSIAAVDGAPVTVLTKPRSRAGELFAADPAVRDVIWLKRNPGEHDGLIGFFRLVWMLRQRRFAKAWLLHGSSRYALALLIAGVPATTGFGRGLQRWLLTSPIALPSNATHGHPINLADKLLEAHGIPRSEPLPRIVIDPAALRGIENDFGHYRRPWVALGIGCSESNRQWGSINFASLAKRLLTSYNISLFLLGGPAETSMAHDIGECLLEFSGRLQIITHRPLNDSAALLSRCALCVANETAVFNLAAALGIPTVGLIVSAWEPPWKDNVVCLRPPADSNDVGAIEVAAVAAAAARLLDPPESRSA
jgi:heptosyltransferase-2